LIIESEQQLQLAILTKIVFCYLIIYENLMRQQVNLFA